MKVSEIMSSDPVSVAPNAPVDEALELMDEHHVRHLPVVEGGRLVGVLSDRDLLQATGWLPRRVHATRGPAGEERIPRTVDALLHNPPVAIDPDEGIVRASMELLERRIGCLPVVDGGRLVGLLTETDVLRAYARALEAQEVPDAPDPTVEERMTPSPLRIHWYTTLEAAEDICRSNAIRHLPVVEAGRLVGLVSDRDLRRARGLGFRDDTPVEEVMTRQVLTGSPSTRMSAASQRMARHKIGALPVLDDDDLVGIVTLSDVFEHALDVFRRAPEPT